MATVKTKPFLRGHFHQAAFFTALGACAMLIMSANGTRAVVATVIYTISLAGLYGISSLYHRPNWGQTARRWMRSLDHSFIFVLIAGSATPVCLLGMSTETGNNALWIFWIAASVGVIQSVFWVNAPKWISALFYLAMGWLVLPYLPEMSNAMGDEKLWLILIGGIIYTIGAVVYALKRPDPFPKVFGYHEIFHVLVMIASVFHFAVVYQLVKGL